MSEKLLPMLAKPFDERIDLTKGRYVAEEKFDGQRLIVRVSDKLEMWSRTGKDSMSKKLSKALMKELLQLPHGTYDGELFLPGGYSSDVSNSDNVNKLHYIVFDVLEYDQHGVWVHLHAQPFHYRRRFLTDMLTFAESKSHLSFIHLSEIFPLQNRRDLTVLVEKIWDEKGEGVIVKDTEAPYSPGKRTSAFMKLKECGSDVLTVTGFAESKGEIMNRGKAAITVLRSDDGVWTVVKTLDDETCRKLEGRFTGERMMREKIAGKWVDFNTAHQDVGRRLRIEYHIRTPDGSYRSGRWDRWEDE